MHFDDFSKGDIFDIGSYEMSIAEIIEFASQYDPQIFHTNPLAAKNSVFGGLVASGFHTLSVMMKLMVENYLDPQTALGSHGLQNINWRTPVRPGDVLRGNITIQSTRISKSKPDRGFVEQQVQLFNQNDELVLECLGTGIFKARNT